MRKSATWVTVTMLIGGCAGHAPPQPEPVTVPAAAIEEPTPREEPAPPATAEPQPPPRRPQALRIDNTSLASFRESWERLHASLSPAQRANLNNVVVELTFAGYGDAANVPANLRSSPIVPEMIRHRIAGLTYAEIIALSR
jgi:hypothetical protein